MTIDVASELVRFHQFVGEKLTGDSELSPEEALDQWRAENPSPDELGESIGDIRQALADMAAGDPGVPWDEFDSDFRKRHQLPPNP